MIAAGIYIQLEAKAVNMRVLSIASIVALLNEQCGQEASLALVKNFGGMRIDVPVSVTGFLLEALGPEITAVLVYHHGGCKIDVPSAGHTERLSMGHAERKSRAAKLRADILTSDLSSNELAQKHGVTSTYILQMRRKFGVQRTPAQYAKHLEKAKKLRHDVAASDLSAHEIAEKHGVGSSYVMGLFRKHGVTREYRSPAFIELREKAAALRQDILVSGMSIREIAVKHGRTESHVRNLRRILTTAKSATAHNMGVA